MVKFVFLFIMLTNDNFYYFFCYLLCCSSVGFLVNLDYLTDNCIKLEGSGYLNHYKCVDNFTSGCPTKPYTDDEIYECK